MEVYYDSKLSTQWMFSLWKWLKINNRTSLHITKQVQCSIKQ